MNNDDEDNEVEDMSMSIEMKRHRSRLSSKRTREKEKSLMDALESERIRLHLSNSALQYHNSHLREAIQAIKTALSNPSSSVATLNHSSSVATTSSSSNQPSENSFVGVPQNVQYNPLGNAGPKQPPAQVLPNNNLAATLPPPPIPQIPQMAPTLTADLSQIVQGNPLLPAGTASLAAGMLQSLQQQHHQHQHLPALQNALQAEINRRMLPAPLGFPMAPVQPVVQPVNLAAAAAAAAALTQWQQLPPGITPQTRIRDDQDPVDKEGV